MTNFSSYSLENKQDISLLINAIVTKMIELGFYTSSSAPKNLTLAEVTQFIKNIRSSLYGEYQAYPAKNQENNYNELTSK